MILPVGLMLTQKSALDFLLSGNNDFVTIITLKCGFMWGFDLFNEVT